MEDEPKRVLIGPVEFTWISFALSFIWVVLGYWSAWKCSEAMWAARFGCIGVLYGLAVLVAFRWKFGLLRSDASVWNQQAAAATKAISTRSFDMAVNRMTDELNKYGDAVRSKWVFLAEVMILGLGTFQWGFGDLIASYVFGVR